MGEDIDGVVMHDYTDKVVLITGAGRGIGRALAEAFADRGAIVAANDITPINLEQTVSYINRAGGRCKDYVYDVAKKMPVQAMVSSVQADWGGIDILVNNAGVEPHASILEMDEWDWRRTIDVNLTGAFFTLQTAGRVMQEQGGGVVVNIGSIAGRAQGLKDRAAYVASKTGLLGLTREAAREFAAYKIRVNAVCPGVIETEMTKTLRQDEKMMNKWLEDIPLKRLGKTEDVVGLVLYLCSDSAAYLTGQAINVDGGKVMS
jgi:NAD(P)-dependent dehydrogenase (short-subunit alcohol dehydrogenase family)